MQLEFLEYLLGAALSLGKILEITRKSSNVVIMELRFKTSTVLQIVQRNQETHPKRNDGRDGMVLLYGIELGKDGSYHCPLLAQTLLTAIETIKGY